MDLHPSAHAAYSRARLFGHRIVVTLLLMLCTAWAYAQYPVPPAGSAPPSVEDELEQLVGRIALYPDDLVAIILPASTNPLQIVQADRYLEKRKTDKNLPVDEKWDDAVKALLNYPEVVKMMSGDLDWTAALGEEVVADQGAVLEAVQDFRRRTQSAGNLKTDEKQQVVVEKEVIKIVPADPQVIYVPQYNPTTVVYAGAPAYSYYPSPYPVYYYPYAPGATFAAGLVWGAAITAAWNGGHYVSHYGGGGNNNINIDRSNTVNVDRGSRPSQQPARGGGSGSQTQWKSDKKPGQVSNTVGKTSSNRVGDARGGSAGGGARAASQPAGGGGSRGGASSPGASTRDVGAGGGSRSGGASASTRDAGRGGGGSAFDGYGSSRQSGMDSSRGASSRNSMSGGASRASAGPSASGGARAGGGGGGRGGRR